MQAEPVKTTQREQSSSSSERTGGTASLVPPKSGVPFVDQNGPQIHRIASRGVTGTGTKLPYLAQIQRSFGPHQISHVKAFTGTRARSASAAIGAAAYTAGERIAFANKPSLHTAAHEAAHVIQQRGGIQLKGGLGKVGDPYERHADQVADRVVAGRDASTLLDRFAGGSSPQGTTQRTTLQAAPLASTPIQRLPVVAEINEDEEKHVLEYKSDKYKYFNWLLRGSQTGQSFIAKWRPKVTVLNSALSKMHRSGNYAYTGNLYRGDKLTDYPGTDQEILDTKGATITIAAYLSTSKKKSFAESCGPDLWKIESNINGVDIHAAGLGQEKEEEVLFPPGSQFFIKTARRKVGMVAPFGTRSRKVNATQSS